MSLAPVDEMSSTLHSRRRFLAGGTAAAAALVSGCGSIVSPARPSRDDGWIDAHVHVWTDETDRFPVGRWVNPSDMSPRRFAAEDWLSLAKSAGVRRAIIVQHSPYFGNDSSYLFDCRRRYPNVFSIIGRVDEHEPDLAARVRFLRQQGARGLRISPTIHGDRTPVADPPNWLKSEGMRTLWRAAANESVAMCPIVSAQFLPTLAPMCAEFSDVRCVIDHLGQIDIQAEDQITDLLRLSEYPNVYVKVSAFYKFGSRTPPYADLAPLIRRVVGEFGASRLMWGSDCPFQLQNGNTYRDSVELISARLSFLTPTDRRAMLQDVAERLFFT